MKKIIKIATTTFLVLILVVLSILGLAFTFVEGRFIFAGDWLAYHSPFNVFLRHLFRLFLALAVICYVVLEIYNLIKRKKFLFCLLLGISFCIYVLSLIMFVGTSNYIDIAAIAIGSLLFSIKLLHFTSLFPHYYN